MPQPSSKARLVITALFVDKQTPAEVAARYGVHRAWVYKLKARYEAEGDAALEPSSRRPKTSPTRPGPAPGRPDRADPQGAGRRRPGRWPGHHRLAPEPPPPARRSPAPRSAGTLTRAGPGHPRTQEATAGPPTSGSKPRCPTRPGNPTSPTTGSPAPTAAPDVDVEIISWLDDCTRYALHISAHSRITGPIVVATFREAAGQHGIPASTLTDNGMVYTVRLAGGRGGRNAFEHELSTPGT